MSNLWINWRFLYWHLQIGPDRPRVAVKFNAYRWHEGSCRPWIEFN